MQTEVDCAIIGAGPAGLTTAHDLALLNFLSFETTGWENVTLSQPIFV